jgi:hypothetical protein
MVRYILIVALGLNAVSSASAQAPQVFAQKPCLGSACPQIGWPATPPADLVVRSFKFTLPGPGTAFVDFNGSMQCAPLSWSASGDFGVIDLATQIVSKQSSTANVNGPSSGRHAMRLITPDAIYPHISAAINLHSTRVITYPSGGNKAVHFKIHTLRMDNYTNCNIFNAAFTILYFP